MGGQGIPTRCPRAFAPRAAGVARLAGLLRRAPAAELTPVQRVVEVVAVPVRVCVCTEWVSTCQLGSTLAFCSYHH